MDGRITKRPIMLESITNMINVIQNESMKPFGSVNNVLNTYYKTVKSIIRDGFCMCNDISCSEYMENGCSKCPGYCKPGRESKEYLSLTLDVYPKYSVLLS